MRQYWESRTAPCSRPKQRHKPTPPLLLLNVASVCGYVLARTVLESDRSLGDPSPYFVWMGRWCCPAFKMANVYTCSKQLVLSYCMAFFVANVALQHGVTLAAIYDMNPGTRYHTWQLHIFGDTEALGTDIVP